MYFGAMLPLPAAQRFFHDFGRLAFRYLEDDQAAPGGAALP
jgi:lauroyl/myristoyl acyltransferase